MTKWQRFGDNTWVNVDQVEVLEIEPQDDGRWQLTATFASGRSYPVGSHDDRLLLAGCTDAIIRGEVSERLRDWVSETGPEATIDIRDSQADPVRSRWWRFGRSQRQTEDSPIAHQPAAIPS